MALAPITPEKHILPGSWDLLKPSIALIRQNIDTMLWFIILPAVMNLLAGQLIIGSVKRFSDALGTQPSSATLHQALHTLGHDLVMTNQGRAAIVLYTLSFIWTLLIYPASIVFMVRASRGDSADVFSCLREGWKYFWRVYGVSILAGIVVIAGFLLFVIPGLYMLRRYLLAPFYLIDRNISIREAMDTSAAESKQFASYIWGVIGVTFAFAIISSTVSSVPYLGVILSLAVSYLYFFGPALRYRTITAALAVSSKAAKK